MIGDPTGYPFPPKPAPQPCAVEPAEPLEETTTEAPADENTDADEPEAQ